MRFRQVIKNQTINLCKGCNHPTWIDPKTGLTMNREDNMHSKKDEPHTCSTISKELLEEIMREHESELNS